MPYKNIEEQKQSQHEWYLKNKDLVKERHKLYMQEMREWYISYKKALECSICKMSGKDYPELIQFHHLNPSDKILNISKMVSSGTKKEKILAEINKCIPVCGNCHAKIENILNPPFSDKSYKQKREWISSIKENMKCSKCGETMACCLTFHHNIKDDNNIMISEALRKGLSKEKIIDEIKKCHILCINCSNIRNNEDA